MRVPQPSLRFAPRRTVATLAKDAGLDPRCAKPLGEHLSVHSVKRNFRGVKPTLTQLTLYSLSLSGTAVPTVLHFTE